MSDNRIFNVNGEGDELLLQTLKLVFAQDSHTCKAWRFSKSHGLILLWYSDLNDSRRGHPFPSPLTAERCFPFVKEWLNSEEAKKVTLKGWDAHTDHDGDNGEGWRVYCEDWGHVDGEHAAICAITPVVLWFGK